MWEEQWAAGCVDSVIMRCTKYDCLTNSKRSRALLPPSQSHPPSPLPITSPLPPPNQEDVYDLSCPIITHRPMRSALSSERSSSSPFPTSTPPLTDEVSVEQRAKQLLSLGKGAEDLRGGERRVEEDATPSWSERGGGRGWGGGRSRGEGGGGPGESAQKGGTTSRLYVFAATERVESSLERNPTDYCACVTLL